MTADESPPDLFMPKPPSPHIDLIRNPGDFNPYAAEVTFIQCTKKHKNMKIILTLSCWYSLERCC